MYNYVWVLLDLLAVLVLVVTVNHCAARGLVRTLVNLLGYMAATAVAGACSAPLARWIYDLAVRDAMRLFLARQLEKALAEGLAAAGDLAQAIPAVLRRIMEQSGQEAVVSAFDGEMSLLAGVIVDEALQEPVLSILRGICFFLLLSIALVVVRRLSRMFGGLYRIPVLGTVNTVLGGLFGVAESLVLLYIAGVGLQLITFVTGNTLPFLNEDILDSTYIVRVFLHSR